MKYLKTDSISVFSENCRHSEPVNLISVICILGVVPIFIGLVQMIFFRRPHLEYCVGQGPGERMCWPQHGSLSCNKSWLCPAMRVCLNHLPILYLRLIVFHYTGYCLENPQGYISDVSWSIFNFFLQSSMEATSLPLSPLPFHIDIG